MNIKSTFILVFFCIHIQLSLHAVDIGSDTAVTRFNTQQILLNGDRVAGFAALQGGFIFSTAGISATWDTFFEVTGNVDLSASTLILNRDLIFRDVSNLVGIGHITGNGHAIEFSSTMTCIPNMAAGGTDCRVEELLQSTQATTVNSVDFSYDGKFLAVGLNSSGSNELLIYAFNGATLTLKDSLNTSPQDVITVRWHPSKLLLAVGRTSAVGADLFMYSVNATTGVLSLVDSSDVGGDAAATAWHPNGNFLVVGTTVNPELYVYPVNMGGTFGTRQSFDVTGSRAVYRQAISWKVTGNSIAVGFTVGGSFDELRVYSFSSTTTMLTLNAINPVDNNTVTSVSWNPVATDLLAVTLLGGNPRLRVFSHNDGGGGPSAGTLTLVASQAENLNQPNRVQWNVTGDCLALGKNNNGLTTEFKIFPYLTASNTIGMPEEFEISSNVLALRWSYNGQYVVIGDNSGIVRIYETIDKLASELCFNWSNVNVVLNSNVSFKDRCIAFVGQSMIDGRGHCLTLNPTSTLRIAANSGLLMENIIIKGISDHRIDFIDNSSTVSLKNVTWILDDDFTMTLGKFDVLGSFDVQGENNTFNYNTTQVSRILSNGELFLDEGVIFNYVPPIANSALLKLTEETSKLVLNSATLHSTTTGLQLDTGILEIGGLSKIISDGTVASQAIKLGNGVSSANNLTIHVLPAANVELKGYILDKNV